MSPGRFGVRHKFRGCGWRLVEDLRFATPEGADEHSLGAEYADADTEVVELTRGMVIVVSSRSMAEKRAAS